MLKIEKDFEIKHMRKSFDSNESGKFDWTGNAKLSNEIKIKRKPLIS